MTLRSLLARLLNPRADLSRFRRPTEKAPEAEEGLERPARSRRWTFNFPLFVGGFMVLLLFVGVLFGPLLAPQNPYLHGRRAVEYVDGVISSPPYPPSAKYPLGTDQLGRDILSMVLYGTRNTLTAAAAITLGRLILGLVLGGVAGWNEGRLMDRLIMGAIQLLISLPMLLVAMILILALDVRRGLPVFVIALCAVGWGEMAQYIRAEFIRIKKEPFLDSGRAIGLTPLELAVRHVLPNVVPVLIVITLLEMGAVLMLLGELGFIGVFIGGGTTLIEGDTRQVRHFTLPEWGAMLAGTRVWARTYPWMVLPTAGAFFLSVTGFNLLGEGLRRLIDKGIFNTSVLLSWRSLAGGAVILAASVYVTLTLGPAPSYRHLAEQVSTADLMRHVEALAAPEMNGRGVGTAGARAAADYIVAELEHYDVASMPGGFLKEVPFTVARPVSVPLFDLVDDKGQVVKSFERLVDFAESVERHGGSGEAEAPLTLVLFPDVVSSRSPEEIYARFKGLDLRGRIAVVLLDNAPQDFINEALIRGAEGVLLVTSDVAPRNQVLSEIYLEKPSLPVFRVTPAALNTILATEGLDLESVQRSIDELEDSSSMWHTRDLDARVRVEVYFAPPEEITVYNVMWLLEGVDAAMRNELVIVSAHYDGLGQAPEPDDTLYPGANSDASGVAAMLEITRLWREQEFQPRRAVLFAAWGGGPFPYSGAHYFDDQPGGFIHGYDISAVLHLDRLGTPGGEGLVVQRWGPRDNLFNLLESSAQRLDMEVRVGGRTRYSYQQLFTGRYGTLVVTWDDPPLAFDADTVETIDSEHLSMAAQAVNLTLITSAQEQRY